MQEDPLIGECPDLVSCGKADRCGFALLEPHICEREAEVQMVDIDEVGVSALGIVVPIAPDGRGVLGHIEPDLFLHFAGHGFKRGLA